MNVPFVTPSAETDAKFVKEAAQAGLVSLKGHRLVGGMRASIYNAPFFIEILRQAQNDKEDAQNDKEDAWNDKERAGFFGKLRMTLHTVIFRSTETTW